MYLYHHNLLSSSFCKLFLSSNHIHHYETWLACQYRPHFCKININPLTSGTFYFFEWFSTFKQSIGFCDSVFGLTMESTAVLKNWRLEFSANVILLYKALSIERFYSSGQRLCKFFGTKESFYTRKWMSVKRGVRVTSGAGVGVYLFLKECCFRGRIWVLSTLTLTP